jgi:hypothetical protein
MAKQLETEYHRATDFKHTTYAIGGFFLGGLGAKPQKILDITKTATAPTLILFYNYNPSS